MKILRLCMSVILSICLVVSTIGSDLFGASMMSVRATGAELALGLDVMYEICEYFGSTFMTYSCGRSLPEISDDDLARLGHDFLRAYSETMYEFGLGPDPAPFDGSFAMVDYNGQSYVFGTEALKETAETEFTVIQGGKNNGDDNDDDDDDGNEDNVIHFPQKVAGAGKMAVAMTASLASLAFSCCAAAYHKWVDGDEDNLLDPFFEQYPDITASDIAKQYSGHGFKLNMTAVQKNSSKCKFCGKSYYGVFSISDFDCFTPTAVLISSGSYHFRYINDRGNTAYMSPVITNIHTCCSEYTQSTSYGLSLDYLNSFTANVPIFTSLETCDNYLKTGTGYEDATNFGISMDDAITSVSAIPPFSKPWQEEFWDRVINVPDVGIGSIGAGVGLNDWVTDIPWVGLDSLWDYVTSIEDAYAMVIEDVIAGVYDPTKDIPDSYAGAWEDAVEDTWVDVMDIPLELPGVANPDIPVDPDIPIDIPVDSVIDIPIEDIVPTVNDSFIDIASSLKYKFPFSIPWDIHHIFSVLADTPKAPYFELPLVIERYGINEKIVIDMSRFQVLSNLSRSMFSMLFAIFLINLTFRVVAMRKEE